MRPVDEILGPALAAGKLLAYWPMMVSRMVTWNQSRTCSACGLRESGRSRTSSPPSVKNVICWFICMPCDLSTSNRRRLGLRS